MRRTNPNTIRWIVLVMAITAGIVFFLPRMSQSSPQSHVSTPITPKEFHSTPSTAANETAPIPNPERLCRRPMEIASDFERNWFDDESRTIDLEYCNDWVRPGPGYKLSFGATVRDVAKWLPSIMMQLRHLAKFLASDYVIVFYHNDSGDNTLEVLKQFQAEDPEHVFYFDEHSSEGSRMRRLAHGRNKVFDLTREHCPDCEFVFMYDSDDKFPVFAVNYLKELYDLFSKKYQDKWDMLSFNRPFQYYDIYALRTEEHPLNCWGGGIQGDRIAYINSLKKLYQQRFSEAKDPEFYPVISAFAGMGLYRMSHTVNCTYKARDAQGGEDCEHVDFHVEMAEKHKAKIRVSSLNMGY